MEAREPCSMAQILKGHVRGYGRRSPRTGGHMFLAQPRSVGWRAGRQRWLWVMVPFGASRLVPPRRSPVARRIDEMAVPVRRVMILSACAWRRVLPADYSVS